MTTQTEFASQSEAGVANSKKLLLLQEEEKSDHVRGESTATLMDLLHGLAMLTPLKTKNVQQDKPE